MKFKCANCHKRKATDTLGLDITTLVLDEEFNDESGLWLYSQFYPARRVWLCPGCVGAIRGKLREIRKQRWGPERAMTFSERNKRRSESEKGFNHKLSDWNGLVWMVALVGEVGEAAKIINKLNRERDGIIGNDCTRVALMENLRDELADAAIYLDLLCQSYGFDLETIRDHKFAKTSAKIGYDDKSAEAK